MTCPIDLKPRRHLAAVPTAPPDNRPPETVWREACCRFLGACFRGSTKERLDFLARDLWHARDAMERQ